MTKEAKPPTQPSPQEREEQAQAAASGKAAEDFIRMLAQEFRL
jgi:hypothetical protein